MLAFYLSMLATQEEQDKFTELYLLYREKMMRVATRILNNESEAEEIVHEAFIKVLENMNKIGEVTCPKTQHFLVIIVKRISLNKYRQNQRKQAEPLDDYTETVPDRYSAEEEVLNKYSFKLVIDTIEAMSDKDKEVLFLSYDQELSVDEIAKQLETSKDSIYKRLARAKERLKASLYDTDKKEGELKC